MRITFFRQFCSFCWDVDIYKLLTCQCLAVSLGFLAGRQDMCPCCLSLILTVLVETLTFVGLWLRRVLDVAYLCWRASRTSALSSRPVVARLLPERGRSFTSPGFSLCLLSILYTVLCDICIVWAMCDTVAHVAFIQMTCYRWLMVPFPHDEVKLPGHKKLTFGVAKVVLVSTVLFKDYMVNFTHVCQTCYPVYMESH